MKTHDLIIIGGGASGLIAAIQAHKLSPHLSVAVLEKADRPGKKLLATGGGRCNIANTAGGDSKHFYTAQGNHPAFVRTAFRRFPVADNLAFFRDLGLLTKEEEQGKIYPLGDQAAAVVDTLRLTLAAMDIPIITGAQVQSIEHRGNLFRLTTPVGNFAARAVIVAVGGNASPKLSNAEGFGTLLAPLGHQTTQLYPALTQLKTADPLPKAVQGIKFMGSATVYQGDTPITEYGEILFTAYGLSGPPILQLSRLAAAADSEPIPVHLDLLPAYNKEEIRAELVRRTALPLKLEDYLTGMLNKRLGQQLIKRACGKALSLSATALSPTDTARLAALIKDLAITVNGTTGWQNAQVMAGGLALKAFDSATLQSKFVPGLFACGEVLDVFGDCGGYNLSWAWSSGRLAATSAGAYLAEL